MDVLARTPPTTRRRSTRTPATSRSTRRVSTAAASCAASSSSGTSSAKPTASATAIRTPSRARRALRGSTGALARVGFGAGCPSAADAAFARAGPGHYLEAGMFYVVCTACTFLRAYSRAAQGSDQLDHCPACGARLIKRGKPSRFEPTYVAKVAMDLHNAPELPTQKQ